MTVATGRLTVRTPTRTPARPAGGTIFPRLGAAGSTAEIIAPLPAAVAG
ncbi:hypothetical protein [Streptomyces sp. NBC_01190]|nr:hypothetical protein OG519_27660 [Streptomyces sp. NBC_01190]